MKDKVKFQYFGEKIPHIIVSNGQRLKNKVLYEVALNDIEEIEERILHNCTMLINRYERFIKIKGLDEIVDRVELLKNVYQFELEYQF